MILDDDLRITEDMLEQSLEIDCIKTQIRQQLHKLKHNTSALSLSMKLSIYFTRDIKIYHNSCLTTTARIEYVEFIVPKDVIVRLNYDDPYFQHEFQKLQGRYLRIDERDIIDELTNIAYKKYQDIKYADKQNIRILMNIPERVN